MTAPEPSTLNQLWGLIQAHLLEAIGGLVLAAVGYGTTWLRSKRRNLIARDAAREAFEQGPQDRETLTQTAVSRIRENRESHGWLERMSDEDAEKRVRKLLDSERPPPKKTPQG